MTAMGFALLVKVETDIVKCLELLNIDCKLWAFIILFVVCLHIFEIFLYLESISKRIQVKGGHLLPFMFSVI